MMNFGHVHRITRSVGGREYTFRSKLEYKWAVWCQLRKEQGIIIDWWYEDEETLLELETAYFHNRKLYLPDFTIQMADGYEFEECKGWFPPKDYTKIKLAAQQYENPITLIFANLTNCKSMRAQYSRAMRLEPHIKRIIWNANKTILNKISGLFDV
ncbi:hypothetical protein LCGC14_2981920 [marine sediment metagenome]|uniref:TnsA endonuclease N-terminal domain-containing protein n=1 Tax=marine sediment metagenome TaxID=412755 RepID=A0A0F8ZDU0_9ZZZZ